MEILKRVCEAVSKKGLNFCPIIGFSTIHKLITEMEHSTYSLHLAPNDFWLFPKIKSALKGRRFQDTENIQKM